MKPCLQCIDSCTKHALMINRLNCYKQDFEKNRFIINNDCSLCNICIDVCRMQSFMDGKSKDIEIEAQINSRAKDCNFCILCNGMPNCIELSENKNMFGLLFSITDYLIFKFKR